MMFCVCVSREEMVSVKLSKMDGVVDQNEETTSARGAWAVSTDRSVVVEGGQVGPI